MKAAGFSGVFVSVSQAKSDCGRTMLDMPLDLGASWEFQIQKDLFVPL